MVLWKSKLYKEGACVSIGRELLREIDLSQIMKGPSSCTKEKFRLIFWQSIRFPYLFLGS